MVGATGAGLIASARPRWVVAATVSAAALLVATIVVLAAGPETGPLLVQGFVAVMAMAAAALLVSAVVAARIRMSAGGD